VHWRGGLGLYVRPRKEKEGEEGEKRVERRAVGGGILGIRIGDPSSAAPVLAGNEVVSRSSVSPAEVPARLSQGTLAIPAEA
jgi:hypothetical protein